MSQTRHLEHASRLSAAPEEVWARVACMSGVNAELGPWLRMTTPAGVADMRLEEAPLGVPLFSSGVLFLGVLPVDVHRFQLLAVTRGESFVEQSTSWTERSWRHERTVEPLEGGQCCLLRDRLTFTPRLALMAPLLVRIVDATFRPSSPSPAQELRRGVTTQGVVDQVPPIAVQADWLSRKLRFTSRTG